jgi:hypothetical protein
MPKAPADAVADGAADRGCRTRMTDERSPGGFSLSRWSRRKLEAARSGSAPATSAQPAPAFAPEAPAAPTTAAKADAAPGLQPKAAPGSAGSSPAAATDSAAAATAATTAAGAGAAGAAEAPLPPIDSLGPDADYTGFFKPSVAPSLRNAALKKLFADPRFNVMDGLDTYIDDYSVSVPLSAEEARGLVQARAILNPPRMRVNAKGHVEPVPPEDLAAEAAAADAPPAEAAEGPTTAGLAAEAAATETATEAARGVTAPDNPDAARAAPALPESDAPRSGAPAPSRHR